MKNRVPTYPGRVTMTPVAGAANTFDMVRSDVPIEEGTPLNKETLLQDSTAALLGLREDATPDDALKALVNISKSAQTTAQSASSAANSASSKVNSLISYGTADLTAGSSSLATGTVYLVYE